MAGERQGGRHPHPPSGLGHRAADGHRLCRRDDRAAIPLARDRRGPVRGRDRAGARRVRAVAEPQGRLLERSGPQVDRRGDRRRYDHRDGAGRLYGLGGRRHRGGGRRVRDRRDIRRHRDPPRGGQPGEGEVRGGDHRAVLLPGRPGRRPAPGQAALALGPPVLWRGAEGAGAGAVRGQARRRERRRPSPPAGQSAAGSP